MNKIKILIENIYKISKCDVFSWHMNSVLGQNSRSRFVCHRATQLKLPGVEKKKHNSGLWRNWSQLGILCTRLLTETDENSMKMKKRTNNTKNHQKMKLEQKRKTSKFWNHHDCCTWKLFLIVTIPILVCVWVCGWVGVSDCLLTSQTNSEVLFA